MKQIRGYVFIPAFKDMEFRPLFGPSQNIKEKSYENILSNDLQVFPTLAQSIASANEYLEDMKPAEIKFGLLKIICAEHKDELETFETKDNLILITKPVSEYPNFGLYGPVTNLSQRLGVLPYQALGFNGFTPWNKTNRPDKDWTPYKSALYALTEANRQGQLPATIGTFSLTIYRRKL